MLGVFIYFRKAFDTVNHEILLHKLQVYLINGTYLEWFNDYLSNRDQGIIYDVYDNIKKYASLDILCNKLLGSILATLLFLIYVVDLCKYPGKLNPVRLADNTNLFL